MMLFTLRKEINELIKTILRELCSRTSLTKSQATEITNTRRVGFFQPVSCLNNERERDIKLYSGNGARRLKRRTGKMPP